MSNGEHSLCSRGKSGKHLNIPLRRTMLHVTCAQFLKKKTKFSDRLNMHSMATNIDLKVAELSTTQEFFFNSPESLVLSKTFHCSFNQAIMDIRI